MKVGQLFIIGVTGKSLNDQEREFLEREDVGGVVLFTHNYEDPAQLAELVNEIQSCRDEYPLFISADQEGGRVIRFKTHFTQFPSMLEISKLDSPKTTYDVHALMATELSACGINLNFSPVCDVLNNPNNTAIGDRAFGRTGKEVEKFISAAIRGLQSKNVLACAKHFPGHGSTNKDSHDHLPYIKKKLQELREDEFIPFYKASRSRTECIMMAHLVLDDLDPELPCTLSKKAHDLLRQELKYKKLILSDDMEMKAITDNFTMDESVSLAMKAGTDILIYRSFEQGSKAINTLKEHVKLQKIPKKMIEDKIAKVLQCKKQHFSEYKPSYIPEISKIFSESNHPKYLAELKAKLSKLTA